MVAQLGEEEATTARKRREKRGVTAAGLDEGLFLPTLVIPDGCRRCVGPCGRVLQLNDHNFRRNGKRPKKGGTGFQSRCKDCMSTRTTGLGKSKAKRSRVAEKDEPMAVCIRENATEEEESEDEELPNIASNALGSGDSDPCPQQIVKITGDGLCLFRCIWQWLNDDESGTECKLERAGVATFNDLIRRIAGAAIEILNGHRELELAEEVSCSHSGRPRRSSSTNNNSEASRAIRVWEDIRRSPHEATRQQWNEAAIDYAWSALRRLYPWICVDVMEIDKAATAAAGTNVLRRKQSFPELEERGDMDRGDFLSVLHTGTYDVDAHYDLLMPTSARQELHQLAFFDCL